MFMLTKFMFYYRFHLFETNAFTYKVYLKYSGLLLIL